MAIRIKCQQCSRRISIDEAFAGGMCRCPYCKAISLVPESAGQGDSPRPASPTERPSAPPPGRPMAPPGGEHHPASRPTSATSGPATTAHPASRRIPTAHRVAVQGAIGLIGVVLLIVLMALLLFYAYRHFADAGKPAPMGGGVSFVQPVTAGTSSRPDVSAVELLGR